MSRTALNAGPLFIDHRTLSSGRSILFLRHAVGLPGKGEGDERGGLDSFGEKAHGALRQDTCFPKPAPAHLCPGGWGRVGTLRLYMDHHVPSAVSKASTSLTVPQLEVGDPYLAVRSSSRMTRRRVLSSKPPTDLPRYSRSAWFIIVW